MEDDDINTSHLKDNLTSNPSLYPSTNAIASTSSNIAISKMGCPFAIFASSNGGKGIKIHDIHNHENFESSSSNLTLTEQMKNATWSVHRQLERSEGVAALMGRKVNDSSSSSTTTNSIDRLDYLRFLIMLTCLYAQMESIILSNSNSNLEKVCKPLLRTKSLLQDVQAHIEEILCSKSGTVTDLRGCIDDKNEEEEEQNQDGQALLTFSVQASQDILLKHNTINEDQIQINMDHINLLTRKQIDSIVLYVHHLQTLSRSTSTSKDEGISFTPVEQMTPSKDLSSSPLHQPINTIDSSPIIAHAYVRYMGDLSGGQHMLKQISKKFPFQHTCSSDEDLLHGFNFYSFDKPTQLKTSFKKSINSFKLDQASIQAIIQEAKVAFNLHHAIFESLIDSPTVPHPGATAIEDSPSTMLSMPGTFPLESFHHHSFETALASA